MVNLWNLRARVGNHNGRCIYLDPVDKPEGERGGGAEALVAVMVGETVEATELAEWFVHVINERLDQARASGLRELLADEDEG